MRSEMSPSSTEVTRYSEGCIGFMAFAGFALRADSSSFYKRISTLLTVFASEWAGPFSPFVNATSSGTAAVAVYRSPGAAVSQLWAIWNSTQTDNNGTTGLTYGVGQATMAGMTWSTGQPVVDTLGNRVHSAFTPSLAVLGN